MTRATLSNLSRTEIHTVVPNRISLPLLLLFLTGVLNACSNDNASQPNKAPEILSISLGCDLLAESVSIQMGDSTEIFLLVDDESPLDLSYMAKMRTPEIASVAVDSEGVLFVSGLTPGRSNLFVTVVDNEGLTDTIVIRIIVDL